MEIFMATIMIFQFLQHEPGISCYRHFFVSISPTYKFQFNPLNTELYPICQ